MTPTMGETERFVQQMVRQIANGELRPGTRLPTESALAGQYGITKTNVHLGVKELERLGFVKVVPRHAVYIADLRESMTLNSLDAVFRYADGLPPRGFVEALLEMREMMAYGILHWMARRPPDRAQLDRLSGHITALEQAATDGDETKIQLALNELLYCFYLRSGNQLFPLLVRSLQFSMNRTMFYMSKFTDIQEMAAVYRAAHHHISVGDRAAATSVWSAWNERQTALFLNAAYPNE